MKQEKNLVIISNEKISNSGNGYCCDNIDLKSLPEGLHNSFEILMIARKSNLDRSHQINLKDINLSPSIFGYLMNVIRTFKDKDTKYLLISITPYTFIAYLILFFFRKNVFVYLRSNGYEEYKAILGFLGPYIYHLMFLSTCWKAKLIVCRSHLLKGKIGQVVNPSQLDKNWFELQKEPDLKKTKLLYIGRLKVEKGIFSLLKIIRNQKINFTLSILGTSKRKEDKINQSNVNILNFINRNDSIINIYDSHNIFILPSFTEGHPQVLDESLSRFRPVIIFEEIAHVIGNRKGVFVCKRNFDSLSKTIDYIIKNYNSITTEMKKNILPTKENFIKQVSSIIMKN